MKSIHLKNGWEEAAPLVATTMLCLKSLIDSNPNAFYELVMKCRDRKHDLFGNAQDVLHERALVEVDGSVHGSIRNIVLSAIRGKGFNIILGDPIERKTSKQEDERT